MCNHRQLNEINLKEENNNNFLNKGRIMLDITCSLHRKRLFECCKGVHNKKCLAVFNAKQTILYCNELLTSVPVSCYFCIYFNCEHKLHDDDNNESKGIQKRRSRQKN